MFEKIEYLVTPVNAPSVKVGFKNSVCKTSLFAVATKVGEMFTTLPKALADVTLDVILTAFEVAPVKVVVIDNARVVALEDDPPIKIPLDDVLYVGET